MSFNPTRVLALCLSFAVFALAFTGCAMKPGSNDSSSAPPSMPSLTEIQQQYAYLASPTVTNLVSGGASMGQILFAHNAHTAKFSCNDCHGTSTSGALLPNMWPMNKSVQGVTMAQLYAGASCGKCHSESGKRSFDAKSVSCNKCHQNMHEGISASSYGTQDCTKCHSTLVEQFNATMPSHVIAAGASHGRPWTRTGSCQECHNHESVTVGGAAAVALASSAIHNISCQTCHHPNPTSQAVQPGNLRKSVNELCGTCHHARYAYIPEFPKVTADATGKTSWPNELMSSTFFGGNAASITAAVNAASMATAFNTFRSRYMGLSGGQITGGNYAHYSSQYDLFMGLKNGTSKAFIAFSRDLNNNTLTYNDSRLWAQKARGCADCHVVGGNHTFKANPTGDQVIQQETFEKSLKELATYLDADGNGTVLWGRSSEDADLRYVMNNKNGQTIATSAKLLLLGAGWNYVAIHEDASLGAHNHLYSMSILNNTITVLKQLKAQGQAAGWWTW